MGSTSKSDMDRIGLFQEMEYVTIKDPFKEAARCKFTAPCLSDFSLDGHWCCFFFFFCNQVNFNEAAYKSKQMMSKSSKERATGSSAGYFDTQFKLLPGSYVDPISMRRKARMEEKKKNIVTKPFVTMYRPRDPYVELFFDRLEHISFSCSEGRGSFYGTLGGAIRDLDPTKPKYREKPKPVVEKSNFKVSPSKKGTGYGYVSPNSVIPRSSSSLTLSSYPNLGISKDAPYAYKDKTDNYDASLNAQKVSRNSFGRGITSSRCRLRKIMLIIKLRWRRAFSNWTCIRENTSTATHSTKMAKVARVAVPGMTARNPRLRTKKPSSTVHQENKLVTLMIDRSINEGSGRFSSF